MFLSMSNGCNLAKRVSMILLMLIALLSSTAKAHAQAITWSTPEEDSTSPVNGASGAAGAAAAVVFNEIWTATMGTTPLDSFGDARIELAYNTTGGVQYPTKGSATYNSQALTTNVMPAITEFNGLMYIAFSNFDSVYDNTNVYDIQFAWSAQNSQTFSAPSYACNDRNSIYGVDGSPSFAVLGDSLYLTFRDHYTQTMELCKIATNNTATVTRIENVTSNFAPTLAVFQNKLYAAAESNDTSHTLDLYSSMDGSTFTPISGVSSDQTSRAPSMAVYNNYLYLAFRENDSSDELLYKYTADGVNFSSTINAHFQNNGPPTLLAVEGVPTSPYNNQLFEFYASFSPTYLCSAHGN